MFTNTLKAAVYDPLKMTVLLDGTQWQNGNNTWYLDADDGDIIPQSELIIFRDAATKANKEWLKHISKEDVEKVGAIFVFYEEYKYFGIAIDVPDAWDKQKQDTTLNNRLYDFIHDALAKRRMEFS